MNVLVRCDMGGSYGLGHATRCLSLAKELTNRGARVTFTSDTLEALEGFVAPYPCGESITIKHNDLDCIIVDTKAPIKERWYRHCAGALGADYVVRIDHPHATPDSCDLLIGPVAHWAPETVAGLRASFGERFLYGWDYVMLDQEIMHHAVIPYEYRLNGPIVFCAGGSDPSGALESMHTWAHGLTLKTDAYFVLGEGMRAWWDADTTRGMHTYAYGPAMYRRMLREAALIVGMFGVTAYECQWYGTPMLMFGHTDENCDGAAALADTLTGSLYGGDIRTMTQERFCTVVTQAYEDPWLRSLMHGATRQHSLDGLGIQRIADAILAL